MKKLIRSRIPAMLCLFKSRFSTMIPIIISIRHRSALTETHSFQLVLQQFLKRYPPEMVRYFTFLIFQCWAVNDYKMKGELTDEGFAAFLDQLNDLVESAYRFHRQHSLSPICVT